MQQINRQIASPYFSIPVAVGMAIGFTLVGAPLLGASMLVLLIIGLGTGVVRSVPDANYERAVVRSANKMVLAIRDATVDASAIDQMHLQIVATHERIAQLKPPERFQTNHVLLVKELEQLAAVSGSVASEYDRELADAALAAVGRSVHDIYAQMG